VLVDGEGRTLSTWGTDAKGTPELAFLSEEGEPRVRLGMEGSGSAALSVRSRMGKGRVQVGTHLLALPGVVIEDAGGAPRAVLGAWGDGSAGLALMSEGMKERLRLMTTKTSVVLSLFDDKHTERLGASVLDRGSAGVMLFDRAGDVRTSLIVEANDIPAITLFDAKEKPRAEMRLFESGDAGVALLGEAGRPLAAMGSKKAGDAGFNTFTADGKPLITLGSRANGDMNLAFSSGNPRPLVELGATSKGAPGGKSATFFSLRGMEGSSRFSVDAIGEDGTRLNLFDGKGRPRAALATAPTGEAGLGIVDENGRMRVSLGSGGAEDGLKFLDEEGKVIHRLP
jgi:hypothetical protein